MQTKMLFGGKLVAGEGEGLSILDPATGDEIAQVAEASEAQVDAAVGAAHEAFDAFSRSTPADRSALLLQIADVLEANTDELAELESLDVGKPWPSARDDEMPLTIDTFRFFAGAARTMTGSAAGEYVEGHTSMIRRDPVGPVAAIAPWNYPLMMAAWKLAAPIAAGCTLVLKPSEITPLSTLRMTEHGGSIVNIGSISGNVSDPAMALYNASKAFVHGLTRSIAVDHGPKVRCNAVSPGWIMTEMSQDGFALARDPKRAMEDALSRHPVGRFGTPEDVASAVAWLGSDQAGYVSGACLTVDGGMTAASPLNPGLF